MTKRQENAWAFFYGAAGYSVIEVLWRGYTHWSMALTGGVCFALFHRISERMKRYSIWTRCLAGSLMVTVVEFCSGCLFNKLLKLDIWDYSKLRYNLFGQVCALFSAIWFVLCIPMSLISKRLRLECRQ